MATLPHELIVEILSRIPAKSLMRFRCVSKLWLILLSESSFIQLHLDRAIERDCTNLFLAMDPKRINTETSVDPLLQSRIYSVEGQSFDQAVEIENPFDLSFRASTVLGSCNGLVCLGKRNRICLLNPSTREYKILMFDKEFNFGHKTVYGLGYDQTGEDYILVQLVDSGDFVEFDTEVNVYSLNDDTSCSTISNIPHQFIYRLGPGIYVNGALHWVGNPTGSIISFNISQREFQEFPRPVVVHKYAEIDLGVLGGQLCMFSNFYYTDNIEMWVMKNYDVSDSWSKLFSIEKAGLQVPPGSRGMRFFENGTIRITDGIKLVIYDPREKSVKNVNYLGISLGKIESIVPHIASLVPLKSGTYLDTITGDKAPKKRKKEKSINLKG